MTISSVLITGGAGFIGSHLAERYVDSGVDVILLDDLSTGRRINLESLERCRRARFVEGSALDAPLVERLLDSVDACIHLAAIVGVGLVRQNPTEALRINVRSTEVVLDAAAKRGLPTLIASSSEVYGRSSRLPFSEEQDVRFSATAGWRWAYAASKLFGERLTLEHARLSGLPVVVTRLFNTTGSARSRTRRTISRRIYGVVRALPCSCIGRSF